MIIRTDAHKAHCLETIANLSPGKVWEVEVREYKEKCTNSQKALYFSSIVEPMRRHLGYDKETMHWLIKGKIFGIEVVEVGGVKMERPRKRLRDLKKHEIPQFILDAEVWGAELGVNFGE